MLNRAKLWKILKILLKISQLFLLIGGAVFVCVYFKKEAPKILGIYAFLLIRPEVFMVFAYADGQNPFAIFLQVFTFTTFTTFATWYAIAPIKNYLRWCFSEIIDFIQKRNKKHAEGGKTNLFQKTAIRIAKFKNWFNTLQKRFLNWFLHGGYYHAITSFAPPPLPGRIGKTFVILTKILVKISSLPFLLLILLGRYNIMIPFTLPVLPSMDTACVILAKVIKLPYALPIFLGINATKIIIILLLCVYAPDIYYWIIK